MERLMRAAERVLSILVQAVTLCVLLVKLKRATRQRAGRPR